MDKSNNLLKDNGFRRPNRSLRRNNNISKSKSRSKSKSLLEKIKREKQEITSMRNELANLKYELDVKKNLEEETRKREQNRLNKEELIRLRELNEKMKSDEFRRRDSNYSVDEDEIVDEMTVQRKGRKIKKSKDSVPIVSTCCAVFIFLMDLSFPGFGHWILGCVVGDGCCNYFGLGLFYMILQSSVMFIIIHGGVGLGIILSLCLRFFLISHGISIIKYSY